MTLAQGAINTGVTKYTAEYGKDGDNTPVLFSTASKISFISSVIVGGLIIIFSHYASLHFLQSDEYTYIFILFGFTIVLFVLNSLLLSILNGLKEIRVFITINIIQSIYSLIFTTLLIVWLGLDGALIALVTNQSVIFFVVLWMLRRHPIIKFENFKSEFNKPEAKKLMGYAAMALTSAATVPVSHILIRNYIGETLGWEQAGYWQAIWYISIMYLMVITTALSVYYLPKLSEITDKDELQRELIQGYKFIIPIVIVLSLVIFSLKNFLILFLFTKEFLPMADLFMWQLIGDVFKVAGWILGMLLAAKAMVKIHMFTQVFFSFLFVGLAILFTQFYGLVGMSYAHALNYVIFLPYIFFVSRWYFSK